MYKNDILVKFVWKPCDDILNSISKQQKLDCAILLKKMCFELKKMLMKINEIN